MFSLFQTPPPCVCPQSTVKRVFGLPRANRRIVRPPYSQQNRAWAASYEGCPACQVACGHGGTWVRMITRRAVGGIMLSCRRRCLALAQPNWPSLIASFRAPRSAMSVSSGRCITGSAAVPARASPQPPLPQRKTSCSKRSGSVRHPGSNATTPPVFASTARIPDVSPP